MKRVASLLFALTAVVAAPGCETDDPLAPPVDTDGGAKGDGQGGELCDPDGALALAPPPACQIGATEYTPRDRASAGTRFPACISDDNAYHPFQSDVPSNARLAAIESIGRMLGWKEAKVPTADDFEQARVLYTQPEGVDSRVQRREDVHYPEAPKLCRDMTSDEIKQYPDRCVGPAKIIPLLNDAFDKGQKGINPLLQAARAEAALIWFMYVSYYKEGLGCQVELNQCDSTSAYWGGNQDRTAAPTGGLGRYIKDLSPEGYERGWDAVLAMRCWRDLDNPTGTGSNVELMNRVGVQLDRAGDHALALIVRHRLQNLGCGAAWETVKILGGVLDRAATVNDAASAEILRNELAKTDPQAVDVKAATSALEKAFPCP
ncbi:MAG: hypothetical protein ABW133_08300 [Polyangiaceae bacterium]